MNDKIGKFVLIFLESGNYFAGTLLSIKPNYIKMQDAIKILSNNKKSNLSQIMNHDSKNPRYWKFFKPDSLVIIYDFVDILDCPSEIETFIKNIEPSEAN